MKLSCLTRVGLAATALLVLMTAAEAQSPAHTGTTAPSGVMSSGTNWGTSGTGGGSGGDSATMHNLNGSSAAQVNAAKQGLLLNAGPGASITAIGSQNIVATTIIGDNNTANINASQTSSNTGNVTTNGTIGGP